MLSTEDRCKIVGVVANGCVHDEGSSITGIRQGLIVIEALPSSIGDGTNQDRCSAILITFDGSLWQGAVELGHCEIQIHPDSVNAQECCRTRTTLGSFIEVG